MEGGRRDLDRMRMSRIVRDVQALERRQRLELVERERLDPVPVQDEGLQRDEPGERTCLETRDPVVMEVELTKAWQAVERAGGHGRDPVLVPPELLEPRQPVECIRRQHGELRLLRDVEGPDVREPGEIAAPERCEPNGGADEFQEREPGEPFAGHPGAVALVARCQGRGEEEHEMVAHRRGAIADALRIPCRGPKSSRRGSKRNVRSPVSCGRVPVSSRLGGDLVALLRMCRESRRRRAGGEERGRRQGREHGLEFSGGSPTASRFLRSRGRGHHVSPLRNVSGTDATFSPPGISFRFEGGARHDGARPQPR